MRNLSTPLDLPLFMFLASGLIGVWASYDQAASWSKFFLLALAVALYYAISWSPQILVQAYTWLYLLFALALGIYFVTQHDFSAQPGKLDLITAIGMFLNRLTPQLNLHEPHPNIVAGVLEVALPLSVAQLVARHPSSVIRRRVAFSFSLFACLFLSFSLFMTGSRGAWLALAAVGAYFLVRAFWRDAARRYALPLVLIALLLLVIAGLRMGNTFWITLDNFFGAIPAGDQVLSRLEVYRQSWGLIQDYYFTGSGLGVFPMVYSTYALLINVPFLTHAHNLFLQVWLEQGLLGFVAFAWLVIEFYLGIVAIRHSPVASHSPLTTHSSLSTLHSALLWGGLAAASVMLLHGLSDVLLYSSRALPLMFVPMGIAVAGYRLQVASRQSLVISKQTADGRRRRSSVFRRSSFVILLSLLFAFIFTLYALRFPLASLAFSTLASIAQTRVELAPYAFPDKLVESTRREGDLSRAQELFAQALSSDPGNVTANQRLGAIALARAQYEAAQAYLQAAYARDATNSVTWQLLGDAYLAQGRVDDASALWSRISDAPTKLETEASVRYDAVKDRERALAARNLAQRLRAAR